VARQEQATYLSASSWMADDGDFEDDVHLSEKGAKEFSRRLAAELSR